MHLVREGLFVVDQLMPQSDQQDAKLKLKQQFGLLYAITEQLETGNLQQALQWTDAHAVELDQLNSSIAFDLRRMQFLLIIGGYTALPVE